MAHAEHAVAGPAILNEVKPAVLSRPILVANNRSFSWITEKICGIIEGKTPAWWWVCFCVAAFVACFTVGGITYLVSTGVGASMMLQILSVIHEKLRLFATSTARGKTAGRTSSRIAGASAACSA